MLMTDEAREVVLGDYCIGDKGGNLQHLRAFIRYLKYQKLMNSVVKKGDMIPVDLPPEWGDYRSHIIRNYIILHTDPEEEVQITRKTRIKLKYTPLGVETYIKNNQPIKMEKIREDVQNGKIISFGTHDTELVEEIIQTHLKYGFVKETEKGLVWKSPVE